MPAIGGGMRDAAVVDLLYQMMSDIETDMNETRDNVASTRKLNEDLERLVKQLTYKNSQLRDSLSTAQRKIDDSEELRRRSAADMQSEVEQSRQAANGEIERTLGSLQQSAKLLAAAEDRTDSALARCEQLEQRAMAAEHSSGLLQSWLTESRQAAAILGKRLEESELYAGTLEAALSEINSSTS